MSTPHAPGPYPVACFDERDALQPTSRPFEIVLTPGAHRLEGSVRLVEPTARELSFAITVQMRSDADVSLVLAYDESSEQIECKALGPR